MNNKIGRKITSLTLMTIMLAGGLTFAIPGVTPEAHAANANLFVSAESSAFDNHMSGPQVIEVLVRDSDINDTDQSKGSPDVTVNGKILTMAQAVDGNWYGYFADATQARIADNTVNADNRGAGLDFGILCAADTAPLVLGGAADSGVSLTDTVGFAVGVGSIGSANANQASLEGDFAACTQRTPGNNVSFNNVVREAKELNTNSAAQRTAGTGGQVGFTNDPVVWPVIQLYDLNLNGNVNIQYNKGGGAQSVTLTFDTPEKFADLSLDRDKYPQNAEVHATITDLWLNIDPTDEDSWTFGTNAGNTTSFGAHYQVFDENGGFGLTRITGSGAVPANINSATNSLLCDTSCKLVVNTNAQNNAVLTIQGNQDAPIDNLFADDPTTPSNNATNFGITEYTGQFGQGSVPVTITEQGPNTGIFSTTDDGNTSVLKITSDARRNTSATIEYNEVRTSILTGFSYATIEIKPTGDEWKSGEEIDLIIVDGDQNKNIKVDDDMVLDDPTVTIIPALTTGDPFTIGEGDPSVSIFNATRTLTNSTFGGVPSGDAEIGTQFLDYNFTAYTSQITSVVAVDPFSQRAIISQTEDDTTQVVIAIVDLGTTMRELSDPNTGTIGQYDDTTEGDTSIRFNFFNYNVESFGATETSIFLLNSATNILDSTGNYTIAATATTLVANATGQGYISLHEKDDSLFSISGSDQIGLAIEFDHTGNSATDGVTGIDAQEVIVADFFSFGFTDDGVQASERHASQIIRIEAEETDTHTGIFKGTLEYVMVNQLNIIEESTFAGITPIDDEASFIVIEDLTVEDAPRVTYNDLGSDGVVTPISAQEDAPSHSGVVSLNQDSYKTADTVVITLEDSDLNVDSEDIDIYTVVNLDDLTDTDNDQVGVNVNSLLKDFSFGSQGRLLDVTFDDVKWQKHAGCDAQYDDGLGATGFTLVETGVASGKFTGDFQIPADWCREANATPETATGLDIEVNYVDYRDASGEIIEVGDSAGVRASTGSVSLDRTVYPVPFGTEPDFTLNNDVVPAGRSLFPIHLTGIGGDGLSTGEYLVSGDLIVHIRVNDPDFDVNPSGEDSIAVNATNTNVGPVKISVIRGSDVVVLGYAGGPSVLDGPIGVGDRIDDITSLRQFGPISEIAPDAGIYEYDLTIKFTDGPADTLCPSGIDYSSVNDEAGSTEADRFNTASGNDEDYCILQGDILQVEYTDPADASGDINTVTDSATFDLRNGVLQSDKSVYIIGSDMILTLIEPDFDLDNDSAETYDLDLIEWDSDAATTTMGNAGNDAAAFDPEPTDLRETGDNTGIFQVVIEIPEILSNDALERGEEIVLEYTDWGPSGSDYVGDEDEDINITVFTSNFGATVSLDQKVYTWTDKVYITIVAPDHNFDGDLVDEIGSGASDPIKVSTRGADLDNYKLVETGTDTGIFTGEVILTGFNNHDADGDGSDGDASGETRPANDGGPTDGLLQADDDDGITVSFEFSEDETVVGSALVRWNIGEVQWLEASYPASGTGVVRVIDPDLNLNPEAVDNFDVDVWSDSDAGGIDLTVTETNESTGIFEGTVFFTVSQESSGHRLRVAEGDTVTAEYEDGTLPDPYTTADELDVTATSLIGTVVPPLSRAPIGNLRVVDAFGGSLSTADVDQQVQISADLANGQDREQAFAYLVQIQDDVGVTVSLAWLEGSLTSGQSFSPSLSWIPIDAGTYTVTAFVWESLDNPTALSPQATLTITVQ